MSYKRAHDQKRLIRQAQGLSLLHTLHNKYTHLTITRTQLTFPSSLTTPISSPINYNQVH